MRFDQRSREARRRWSRNAVAAKSRKRMAGAPPEYPERPTAGLLLHTIRVTSHLHGVSFEVKVRQAGRLNQVTVETFGRASQPHGVDWLTKHLRQRLVTRWTPTKDQE